jgi:hypothetical protein
MSEAAFSSTRDWSGLPPDLLHRCAVLLGHQAEPVLLAVCKSWHTALKRQITSISPFYLGRSALGQSFTAVRVVNAPLVRRSEWAVPYVAPLSRTSDLQRYFPSAASLRLAGQDLGPGAQLLVPLAGRLTDLDVAGCALDLSALQAMTALTQLGLDEVRVSALPPAAPSGGPHSGALALLGGLPRLHSLSLRLQPGPPLPMSLQALNAVSALCPLKGLRCLRLGGHPLAAGDVSALSALSGLTSLELLWSDEHGLAGPPGLQAWQGLVVALRHSLQLLDVTFAGCVVCV